MKLGVSVLKKITSIQAFSIDQLIPANSDYIASIVLGRNDWKVGYVTMWANNIYTSRRSIYAVVTRDENKSFAQSVDIINTTMPRGYLTYIIENWDYSGFSFATDSYLSNISYGGKYQATRFFYGKIIGTILSLKFHNYSTYNDTLNMQGKIKLIRDDFK